MAPRALWMVAFVTPQKRYVQGAGLRSAGAGGSQPAWPIMALMDRNGRIIEDIQHRYWH